jgi:hypothetical protein
MILLTPELSVPLPSEREKMLLLHEKTEALFNTAEFLIAFGVPAEPTEADQVAARAAFHESANTVQANPLPLAKTEAIKTSAAARHLKAVLSEYDEIVVKSAVQIRTYVTNKLIEETTHPDARIRMRALELLGKVGDVGLFVERSEVTVRHKTTVELEDSIKSRIAKLLELRSAAEDVVDVDPKEPDPKGAAAELLREDTDD